MDLKDTNLVADERELNAFVDGCLAGTRRQAVLERLARDPAAKARLDALGRQNALLAALRQSLNVGHASLSLLRLEQELCRLVANAASAHDGRAKA